MRRYREPIRNAITNDVGDVNVTMQLTRRHLRERPLETTMVIEADRSAAKHLVDFGKIAVHALARQALRAEYLLSPRFIGDFQRKDPVNIDIRNEYGLSFHGPLQMEVIEAVSFVHDRIGDQDVEP